MKLSILLGAALAVLAFAVYIPGIGNGVILDDDGLLHADLSLQDLLFEPGPPSSLPYYRPITVSTYQLLKIFGQGDAQVHAAHVMNSLLYAGSVAAVFWLCLTLLRGRPFAAGAAFGAGLLFALHPIHTETVAWITARPDMIVSLWIVGALGAYARYRSTGAWWWLAMAGAAALAAPLSKEIGASVFLLLPAFELLYVRPARAVAVEAAPQDESANARRRRRAMEEDAAEARAGERRQLLTAAAAVAAAAVLYLIARLIAFDSLGNSSIHWSELKPAHFFGALGFYATKMFVPVGLLAFRGTVPTSGMYVTAGFLFAAGGAALLALALWRRAFTPAFGIIWIAVTLFLGMPLFVSGPSFAPVAERYLYLPTIGLAICIAWVAREALAWVGERWSAAAEPSRTRVLYAAAAVPLVIIAAAFAYGTVTRLHSYSNLQTFFETAIARDPGGGIIHAGLAQEYDRQGRHDDALQEYLTATGGSFAKADQRAAVWNNLGAFYAAEKDYANASPAYERAIALDPDKGSAYFNYALMYRDQASQSDPKDRALLQKALAQANLAVEREPNVQEDLMLMARIAIDLGDNRTARDAYARVVKIDGSTAAADLARRQLAQLPATP